MRIAITGSTGLIGEALTASLRNDAHEVIRVTRSPDRASGSDVLWDPQAATIRADGLRGVEAVVHLAGEPFDTARWNPEVKRRIQDSRVRGTRLIAETLAELDERPAVLLCASGAHYYGDRGDEVVTEDTPAGEGFMAEMCVAWEAAADPAREAGIRVVHARTGAVIAREGPLMRKVDLPFRLGLGGRVGSGRQYVPWISPTDVLRALRFLIDRDDLAGPVNLTAPEPVTNRELTRALGEVMRRPAVLPIPLFVLRLVYGEVAVALAVDSIRVVPQRLLDAGFSFIHTDIRAALRAALGERRAA